MPNYCISINVILIVKIAQNTAPNSFMKQLLLLTFQLIACLSIAAQDLQDLSFGTENTLKNGLLI